MKIQRINNLLRKLQPFAEKFIDEFNNFCKPDENLEYVDINLITNNDLEIGYRNRSKLYNTYKNFLSLCPIFIIECNKQIPSVTNKTWEFVNHYGLAGEVFLNEHNLYTFVFPLGEKIKQYLEED